MSASWTHEHLNDYLDDRLSPSDRTNLESTLHEDTAAAEALRDLQQLRQQLNAAPRFHLDSGFVRRVVAQLPKTTASGLALADSVADRPEAAPETLARPVGKWQFAAAAITTLAASLLLVLVAVPWLTSPDAVSRAPDQLPAHQESEFEESEIAGDNKRNAGASILDGEDRSVRQSETKQHDAGRRDNERAGDNPMFADSLDHRSELNAGAAQPAGNMEDLVDDFDALDERQQGPENMPSSSAATPEPSELADADTPLEKSSQMLALLDSVESETRKSVAQEIAPSAVERDEAMPDEPMAESVQLNDFAGGGGAKPGTPSILRMVQVKTSPERLHLAQGIVQSPLGDSQLAARSLPNSQFQFKKTENLEGNQADEVRESSETLAENESVTPVDQTRVDLEKTQYVFVHATSIELGLILDQLGGQQTYWFEDGLSNFVEPGKSSFRGIESIGGQAAGERAGGDGGEFLPSTAGKDMQSTGKGLGDPGLADSPGRLNKPPAKEKLRSELTWQALVPGVQVEKFQKQLRRGRSEKETGGLPVSGIPGDQDKLEIANSDTAATTRHRYLLVIELVDTPNAAPTASSENR